MDEPAQELHHGDIIEVISDFDPGVVEPGDRALNRGGMSRWVFHARVQGGIAPIYDAILLPNDFRWKIVGRVEEEEFDFMFHSALRPQRREHFNATITRHKKSIRHLWASDHRRTMRDFMDLLCVIVQEEPGLLEEQIFLRILEPILRPSNGYLWWTKRNKQRLFTWMNRSIVKLESEGRIRRVKSDIDWISWPGVRLYPINVLAQ